MSHQLQQEGMFPLSKEDKKAQCLDILQKERKQREWVFREDEMKKQQKIGEIDFVIDFIRNS